MEIQEDKNSIPEYLQNELKKIELKKNLKSLNIKIIYPDESFFMKKNSSIKRNSGLVKKIKSFSDNNKESILKDLKELNLTKYVEEIAQAIVECKIKFSDINFMLELSTNFHQLYQDFSVFLFNYWKKLFTAYREDKVKLDAKVKVDLKFFLDLIIINIIPLNDGTKLLCSFLNYLINSDTEEYSNLSILLLFLKISSFDLFGHLPTNIELACEQFQLKTINNNCIPDDYCEKFKNLFGSYYDSLFSKLKDYHKSMNYTKKINTEIFMTKGEVSKEREERLVIYREKFEKLNQYVLQLSDLMKKCPPELKDCDPQDDDTDAGVNARENEGDYDFSDALFEDEDTKLFYESLCNLKAILPGICYKDLQHVETQEEELEMETELDIDAVEKEIDNESKLSDQDSADISQFEEPEKILVEEEKDDKSAVKAKLPFDNFLNSLTNCINRDLIDKASQEFCEQYNTKANRTRLARELFCVSKNRYDLLPFYSRLIANLNQITNEIATEVCHSLFGELRWHIHKKIQTNLESKIKTSRFIGELVKFGVFKKSECHNCIKELLRQFQHHNIDMACALLETCGRYLYRSKDSHLRTEVYLKIMLKRKNATVLDQKYLTMIDNAYYYCNPPLISSKFYEIEDITPEQAFLRKLLYVDLNKHNNDKIFKLVRKFDWNDINFLEFAIQTFTDVWRVKFNNVPYLASVLAGLTPYHEELVVSVVDNLIEEIRVGMEINDPKYNQNRVSVIRYLGYFYVYKLVNASVIFNVLYSLISFGVCLDNTMESQLDPGDNYFRVNLIYTLLDCCGQYFKTGSVGKKLDVYFLYLQQYFLFKKSMETLIMKQDESEVPTDKAKSPFTILIEGQLNDMITSLRPKCKIYTSLEDIRTSIEKFEADCIKKLNAKSIYLANNEADNNTTQGLHIIEEEASEDGMMNQEIVDSPANEDEEDVESSDETGDNVDDTNSTPDEATNIANKDPNKPRFIACQEDMDFQQMVDQMQAESLQIHQNQASKVVNINVTLPKHMKTKTDISDMMAEDYSDTKATVPYALVSKKSGKNQYTEINVPRNVEFVSKLIEATQASEKQRKSLNKVVLAMHHAQQQEEYLEETQFNHFNTGNANPYGGDRRPRNPPSRGVPDTSEIFGTAKFTRGKQ